MHCQFYIAHRPRRGAIIYTHRHYINSSLASVALGTKGGNLDEKERKQCTIPKMMGESCLNIPHIRYGEGIIWFLRILCISYNVWKNNSSSACFKPCDLSVQLVVSFSRAHHSLPTWLPQCALSPNEPFLSTYYPLLSTYLKINSTPPKPRNPQKSKDPPSDVIPSPLTPPCFKPKKCRQWRHPLRL